MLDLKKVAITGSLASGKSTVCGIFEKLGASIVNADKIVHQLLSPSTLLGNQLLHLLGPEVIKQGLFDRKLIAAKIFSDPFLRREMEALLHPPVFRQVAYAYEEAAAKKAPLFAAEIPLLFETKGDSWFDAVIVVDAPKEIRQQRFIAQGGTQEEFEAREKSQMPSEEKRTLADFLVMNDRSSDLLENQVCEIFKILTKC